MIDNKVWRCLGWPGARGCSGLPDPCHLCLVRETEQARTKKIVSSIFEGVDPALMRKVRDRRIERNKKESKKILVYLKDDNGQVTARANHVPAEFKADTKAGARKLLVIYLLDLSRIIDDALQQADRDFDKENS